VPPSVSITAETGSGSIVHWIGPWAVIRQFLALHMVGNCYIPTIESELRRGNRQAFEIETSETLLSLAGSAQNQAKI
jgi:hypothetical protein